MFSLRLKSRSGLIIAGEAAIEFDIDAEVSSGGTWMSWDMG